MSLQLAKMAAKTASIELSLDKIRILASRFPTYTRPTIHVAGTNGKGSVTSIIASILQASGLKVGKFNSPHLITVRDSISISGSAVQRSLYDRVRGEVDAINSQEIGASSFEALTITALRIFEEFEKVDVAVLEVGMGGRLDATNVIPDDCVVNSIITSIDYDHTKWLGETIDLIAAEKAGIIRPKRVGNGAAVIVGRQTYANAERILKETTRSYGGRAVDANTEIDLTLLENEDSQIPPHPRRLQWKSSVFGQERIILHLPLPGAHQQDNLAIALASIESLVTNHPSLAKDITPTFITEGVRQTTWPGRLSWMKIGQMDVLVDGAHNEGSAKVLREYVDNTLRSKDREPRTWIIALSHSPPKTPASTLLPLLSRGDRVAIVGFSEVEEMPWVSYVPLKEVAKEALELVGQSGEVRVFDEGQTSLNEHLAILKKAFSWAQEATDLTIVAGSLYLVADVYRSLAGGSS